MIDCINDKVQGFEGISKAESRRFSSLETVALWGMRCLGSRMTSGEEAHPHMVLVGFNNQMVPLNAS